MNDGQDGIVYIMTGAWHVHSEDLGGRSHCIVRSFLSDCTVLFKMG